MIKPRLKFPVGKWGVWICTGGGATAMGATAGMTYARWHALYQVVKGIGASEAYRRLSQQPLMVGAGRNCLACGEAHHGFSGLPCPRMSPSGQYLSGAALQ